MTEPYPCQKCSLLFSFDVVHPKDLFLACFKCQETWAPTKYLVCFRDNLSAADCYQSIGIQWFLGHLSSNSSFQGDLKFALTEFWKSLKSNPWQVKRNPQIDHQQWEFDTRTEFLDMVGSYTSAAPTTKNTIDRMPNVVKGLLEIIPRQDWATYLLALPPDSARFWAQKLSSSASSYALEPPKPELVE